MVLLRVLLCAVVFTAPVALYIIMSGKKDNLLLLLFPMIGIIPAVIGALLVFWPLEALLDGTGRPAWKNYFVPIAGACLIIAVVAIVGGISGKLAMMLERIASNPVNNGGPILLWMVLGLIWGILWRMSDWALTAGRVAT